VTAAEAVAQACLVGGPQSLRGTRTAVFACTGADDYSRLMQVG
jgi:hypothetical protein